jgi:hypothetical protein
VSECLYIAQWKGFFQVSSHATVHWGCNLSDLHLLIPKTLSMPTSAPRPRHDLVRSRHLQPLEKLPDQVYGKRISSLYIVHVVTSRGSPLALLEFSLPISPSPSTSFYFSATETSCIKDQDASSSPEPIGHNGIRSRFLRGRRGQRRSTTTTTSSSSYPCPPDFLQRR